MPDPAAPTIAVRDFYYIAPEIVLTVWGLLLLLVDLTLLGGRPARTRRNILGGLGLVGVVATLAVIFLDPPSYFGVAYDDPDPILFFGTLAGDVAATRLNVLVTAMLGLVVGMSMAESFTERWGEYFALLFWAAVGMLLLIAAEELIVLFVALETMTLCLYMSAAFEKSTRRSPEAGLKYFIYGSVSSALFLFGLSLIFGMTGTTRLDAIASVLSPAGSPKAPGLDLDVTGAVAVLLVVVGFGFKIAAVPFHQWVPDVYAGAPTPVTAWIASGSKIASFVALLKVFDMALKPWAHPSEGLFAPGWIGLLAVVAAVTMTFGNLAALSQRHLKRMLAYSAIAHAGYILVGVVAVATRFQNQQAAGAVLFYLVVYGFTKVAAFAVAAWLIRDRGTDRIEDLDGLGQQSPLLAFCILLLMLSLIGIPPLAGFFGKLYLFMEALDSGEQGRLSLTWLVAIGLLNTVISSFYYVRVLRAMYLRPPGERPLREPPPAISLPIVLGTIVAVAVGIVPAPLLDTMKGAAVDLLSVSRSVPARVGPAPVLGPPPPEAPDDEPTGPPILMGTP